MDDGTTQKSPEPSPKPKPTSRRDGTVHPLWSPSWALQAGLSGLRRSTRLKSMWPRMDRLCQPQSGRFWVVGGRPGNYKTQFLWNLALDMAERRQRVLFVSLEQEAGEMSVQAAARFSRIDHERIALAHNEKDGVTLSDAELDSLAAAEARMTALELTLRMHGVEGHGRTIDDVVKSACRVHFDAVFIDHVGMLAREGRNELDELSRAVDRLRGLSRGEVVADYRPFVCTSSPLNRDEDRDGDKERQPRMSDFRGSGRIESDADLAMILRKRKRADEEGDEPDVLDAFVLKNRQGRSPLVLMFEGQGAICLVTERQRKEAGTQAEHWTEGR